MARQRLIAMGAVVGCLVLALAGQAFAVALVPSASGSDTNRAVGRATNSYLTGLRTYAAAALWNRIDPLLHNYYENVPLDQQLYMLTTVATVQALDPHAVRSYSVGSWLLVRNDRVDEGIKMAERGVEENPQNGIVLGNLAQILWLYGDKERSVAVAERAMGADVVWPEPNETYSWYATMHDIFDMAGRTDLRDAAAARMAEIADTYGVTVGQDQDEHE